MPSAPKVDPKRQALAKKLKSQMEATSKAMGRAAADMKTILAKVEALAKKEAAAGKVVERFNKDHKLKTKIEFR